MAMSMSAPGMALFGGTGADLQNQVKDETTDQAKKRRQLIQQRLALGPAGQSLGLGGFGAAI
jgi:hypothetical protein